MHSVCASHTRSAAAGCWLQAGSVEEYFDRLYDSAAALATKHCKDAAKLFSSQAKQTDAAKVNATRIELANKQFAAAKAFLNAP